MRTRQTLNLGTERFRVGPWHADDAVAYLALSPEARRPSADGLQRCLAQLRDDGYSSVITAALHPDEATVFARVGFVEYDRLMVLSHDLRRIEAARPRPPRSVRLRRGRLADRVVALEVDRAAFPLFWRLDESGLQDALAATPHRRFRVAECDDGSIDGRRRVVGYAITGRSARQGFLQRLATDPVVAGRGIGSELVVDALRWAARRHVGRMLVNTQRDNTRALELYQRLGFEQTPTDLVVLTRPIT